MPALPRHVLREIRDVIDCHTCVGVAHRASLVDRIDRALSVPRGVKLARKEKRAKKETRREKVSAIREAVMARAKGHCEYCGVHHSPLEMDHALGGSSRRVLESVAGCWGLCLVCHRAKTVNAPSAEYWLEKFLKHSSRHGYDAEPQRVARARLGSLEIQAQLAQPKGATP